MKKYLFGLSCAYILVACQASIQPLPFDTASAVITYDETEQSAKGEILFFKDKKNLAKNTGTVSFQDKSMNFLAVGELSRYQTTINPLPSLPASFTFTYQKEEAIFAVEALKFSTIKVKDNTISQNKGFTLTWEGSRLENGETINLLLTDEKQQTVNIVFVGPTETTAATVVSTETKNLPKGLVNISAIRRKNTKTTLKSNTEFSSIFWYYAKSITAEVKE